MAVACLLAAAFAVCGHAAPPERVRLSAEELAQVSRIESYLNRLRTLRARFVQVSSNGAVAEGNLYLSRPGRMRIEYDPPVPVLIVATGTLLVYFDKELEQVSHLPLSSTPVAILTRETISLQDPELILTGFESEMQMLRITLVQADDPMAGSVTLAFSVNPIALKKWSVVDAQGVETQVMLQSPAFDLPLDAELFRFQDPRTRRDRF
jgi:outer membrane lipoprotein-sorting protein